MARLTITIASDNDALINDSADLEVNDILGRLKAKVFEAGFAPNSGKVLDSNGQAVGTWEWIPGETES